jgi:RNAse (barnase) inhibitor barstar
VVNQVEISNVTGFRGVASETTLLALLDVTRRMGGGANEQQSRQRIQDLYNRSVREATGSVNSFKEALQSTTSTVKDFGRELAIGGDRLSDFSASLFGGSSVVTSFINYIDRTIDQFRELSSVGAGFNNSIFDMILSSANAAMTLNDFVNMVRENSQGLASFGGSVTQGAQTFARMSREFRLGIGSRFFEMGLTINDVNDGLMSYIQLETMRGRRNLRTDANLQDSASNYMMQLDQLSRMTGRQRDQLMATQEALQTDARVRNYINRAAMEGGEAAAENARAIFTLTRESLPGFHEALVDLSDGVAQSDFARALESRAPGITAFMQAASRGAISQEDFVRGIQTRFGPQLESFVASLDGASIEAFRSAGGYYASLAELADATYQISNIMNYDAEEAQREQGRRDRVTATLGRFEQGIIALRKFIFDRFINSAFARRLGEFGQMLINQFDGTGTGTFARASEAFNNFFDRLFGEEGILTEGLNWFVNWIQGPSFGRALENVGNMIGGVIDWFEEFMNDVANPEIGLWGAIRRAFNGIINYVFGEAAEPTTPGGESGPREGGLLSGLLARAGELYETMLENLSSFWNDFIETIGFPEAEGENDSLWSRLQRWVGFPEAEGENDSLWSRLLRWVGFPEAEGENDSLWSRLLRWVGFPEAEGENDSLWSRLLRWVGFENNNEPGTSLIDRIVGMLENVLERLFSGPAIQNLLVDISRSIEMAISGALSQAAVMISGSSAENAEQLRVEAERARTLRAQLSGMSDNDPQRQAIMEELRGMGYSFAQGTNGFQNFSSKGSLAVLHNTEAVVPRNTPAGELLQQFYDLQNRGTNASQSMPSYNQSDIRTTMNQLNTTMERVAYLIQESNVIQSKTMKNTRSFSGNMFRGAGI